jgi:iron complex outermembrane receptor protein
VRPVLSQPKHSNFISVWGIFMTAILLALAPAARAERASSAAAQETTRYRLEIPREALAGALKDFAIQTGMQIARFADADANTGGANAARAGVALVGPLSGLFTVGEGLERLLSGSGLTYRIINPHTIAIVSERSAADSSVPAPADAPVAGSSEALAANATHQGIAVASNPPAVTQNARNARPTGAHRSFFARLASIFAICGAATLNNPACAQEAAAAAPTTQDQPDQLQEVVVTGTSIRGVAPTGSELVTISRDDIQATGATTGTELLRSVPQMGSFNALGANTGSNQANFVDQPAIHGIGVGNGGAGLTLVLFDGHRLPGAGVNQTAPDAGVIPPSIIDRVEVMADGGSSVYGSDAVAGVVNFVPRRNFDGAESSAREGFADGYHSDNFSQVFGKTWGSGSILLDYEYSANAALNGSSRPYVFGNQTPWGGPDTRSNVCSPANISAGGASFALTSAGVPVAGATNLCESNRNNDLYPEQHRNQLYVSLKQDLSDNVGLYASTLYSGRTMLDHVSGAGVTSGAFSVTVPSTSPYYVTLPGVAAGTAETVTYDPAADFGSTFTNRITTNTSSTVAGADIQLGRGWKTQVELNYGLEHDDVREYGINQTLASADALAGTFNPYGVGTPTNSAVLASIGNFNTRYFARQLLEEGQIKADGPLFDMPGGPVKGAFGIDTRREEFDGLTSAGATGGPFTSALYEADSHRTSASAFAELFFPLISELNHFAFAQKLDLSLSGRFDHYSDVGGTTNPKIGLNWTIVDGVLVRASAGRSFHAPSLADAPTAIDTRAIRFGCIPAFQGCPDATAGSYTVILAGGNKLKPETAKTYNLGIDLSPTFLDGFKASATYFRVDYDNVITFPTFAPVTNPAAAYDAYRTVRPAGITDAQWLAIIAPLLAGFRHDGLVYPDDPTLPNAIYDLRRQNFADELINGFDYDLGYRFDTGAGVINTDLAGTQFLTFYQKIPGVTQLVQLIDTDYAVRTKLRWQVGWAYREYAASVFLNYTGHYRNQSVTPFQEVGSFITVDSHLAWSLPDEGILKGTQLTLDALNLFNRPPPVYFTSGTNGIIGFDPAVASALGRVISVGLHKSW